LAALITWLAFVSLLALLAAAELVSGIVHSAYDAHENRAPAARIVLAALTLTASLLAATAVFQRLRGGKHPLRLGGSIAVTVLAVLLLLLLGLADIASGPL